MRFITLLLALITPFLTASADIGFKPRVFTTAVVCAKGVDCPQSLRSVKNTSAFLKKRFNVTLLITKIYPLDEEMSGPFFVRTMKWKIRADQLGVTDHADLTLFMMEPFPMENDFFDFREEGVMGLASGIGVLGLEPSHAFAKVVGSDQLTTRILIHEVGHLLGATHTDEGLMQPTVTANQYTDEYSLDSFFQIVAHLARLAQSARPSA
jgi:hypothetical protein